MCNTEKQKPHVDKVNVLENNGNDFLIIMSPTTITYR